MGARAEAPALHAEVLLPEQWRERPSSDTTAQNWRWASDGPKAEAREAKTMQVDKVRDAPEDLS